MRPKRAGRRPGPTFLLWQPLVPVFGEGIHVVFGHGDEGADVFDGDRVFLEDDFVDEVLDGFVAPLVALLRKEHGDVAAADVGELRGESVDGDALDGAGLPLEGVLGEQRPATLHIEGANHSLFS